MRRGRRHHEEPELTECVGCGELAAELEWSSLRRCPVHVCHACGEVRSAVHEPCGELPENCECEPPDAARPSEPLVDPTIRTTPRGEARRAARGDDGCPIAAALREVP